MSAITRVLLALVLSALLAACSDIKFRGDDPLHIGVVGPMSGPLTNLGGQLRFGAGQAMDDLNRRGGVLDRQFTMRSVDDRCEAKRAEAIARGLALEKIDFVIGHFCSAASIAAAPIYGDANILEITPSSSDPALTDKAAARGAQNIFRLVPRDDMQGPALAAYILAHDRDRAVALVQDDSTLGSSIVAAAREALAAGGMPPAIAETIVRGSSDFAPLVGRLKAAKVGVTVFGGYAREAALFLVEARRQGLETVLAGGETLAAEEFRRTAGAAAEGTVVTTRPDPRDLPIARTAIDGLGAWGIDAGDYALRSYAAMQLVAQAASRAQSLAPMDVAKALHAGQFDTVIGQVSFDQKGDLKDQHFVIQIWQGGRLVRG